MDMKWKIIRFYIVEASSKSDAREVLQRADYLGTSRNYWDGEMVKELGEGSILSHAGDQVKGFINGFKR